jgi:hypothetical protein
MPKVSKEMRDSMRTDHKKLSIKEMCDKYNVSKATIHRIVAVKESSASVNVPTIDDEFAGVLSGKETKQETKQEVELPRQFPKERSPLLDSAVDRLADQIFSEPSLPPHIVEAENRTERTALTQRIVLNVDNFLPIFKFIDNKEQFIKSLHNKSIADLKGLLETMETMRTTVNLATQMKSTFFIASRGVEIGGQRFLKMRTEGLTDALLQQKEELDMIFREIAIDYAPYFKVTTRPELRLAILFATTVVQTDNSNRIKDIMAQRSAVSPQETEQKYGDL